jgi:hypothetical protein
MGYFASSVSAKGMRVNRDSVKKTAYSCKQDRLACSKPHKDSQPSTQTLNASRHWRHTGRGMHCA